MVPLNSIKLSHTFSLIQYKIKKILPTFMGSIYIYSHDIVTNLKYLSKLDIVFEF